MYHPTLPIQPKKSSSSSSSSPSSPSRSSSTFSHLLLHSPRINVFDIPELLLRICSFLSQEDLFHCIQLDKSFYSLCIPLLYSDISITKTFQFHRFKSRATQAALISNGLHIRSFQTRYYSLLRCLLHPKVDCRNLTNLEFPRACRYTDPEVPGGFQVHDKPSLLSSLSQPSAEGPTGDQATEQLRSEDISNLGTHFETRARNAVGLFEGKLLIDMMDKCPRLSVFVMVGFPFDNDQLIRQIGDRVARASANATFSSPSSCSSSSSHKASGLASSVSIPSTPYYTGLKKLELTNLYFCRVKAKPVEYLLNHCTPDLEELLLSVSFGSRTEAESDDTDDANVAQIPETSNTKTTALTRTPPLYEDSGQEWKLRKLTIKGDLSGPGPLIWLPLLRRCSQLQEICVDVFKYETMEQLATTLSRCCPKISEITLQCITGGPQDDSRIADLIKASRSWKRLSMSFFHGFGPLSTTALIKHSGTLETLVLEECDGITSEDIQLVLTSCSNLKTFRAMTSNGMTFSSTVYLDANDMVDSPWVCQNLENLKLVITGIARPDLQENQYGEQFVGPLHDGTITGYDLQKTVYEQLGKLTKLQELWLGHDKQDLDDEENYHPTEVEGQWQFIDPDEQFECPEFSLKSGLDLLHGLKDLKVLNIDRMKTKIGLSEVQWMVKHWPKLEKIIGLVIQGEKTPKHVQWLYDNRPDIELPPVLGHFITAFSAF